MHSKNKMICDQIKITQMQFANALFFCIHICTWTYITRSIYVGRGIYAFGYIHGTEYVFLVVLVTAEVAEIVGTRYGGVGQVPPIVYRAHMYTPAYNYLLPAHISIPHRISIRTCGRNISTRNRVMNTVTASVI